MRGRDVGIGAGALFFLLLVLSSGKASAKLVLSGEPMTDDEMKDFATAVRALGIDPAVVIAVYNLESRMRPHAMNTTSGAQGLAQLMPATLKAQGYTGDPLTFHTLDVRGQLPMIVALLKAQIAANGGPPTTPARLMHLQLHPSGIQERGNIVYTNPEAGYRANASLDHGGKGFITEADLELAISDSVGTDYHLAMAQLARTEAA
jgi:Transglycosylase SLT domain